MANHLVVAAGRCTCDGPFETYGHRPECGYEPVMTLDELAAVLALAGRTVLEPAATDEQWFVWAGGPDPDNAAMRDLRDDEADAREYWQWVQTVSGSGIARRDVYYGPWEIVASESSGEAEPEAVRHCYCGGPEEAVFGHAYGKGLYCRKRGGESR
jgi:hypothetical protein